MLLAKIKKLNVIINIKYNNETNPLKISFFY